MSYERINDDDNDDERDNNDEMINNNSNDVDDAYDLSPSVIISRHNSVDDIIDQTNLIDDQQEDNDNSTTSPTTAVSSTSRAKQVRKHLIGTVCVLIVVCLWVSSSIIIQIIFTDEAYDKPFFLTYYSTSIFTFYLFGYLFKWKKWSTIPFTNSPQSESFNSILNNCINNNNNKNKHNKHNNNNNKSINNVEVDEEDDDKIEEIIDEEKESTTPSKIIIKQQQYYKHNFKSICKISLCLCPIWFAANYAYNLSLDITSVSSNTILSTLSGVFSLILSVILKVDKFSIEKLVATLISLTGIILVSYSDIKGNTGSDTVIGDILAVVGAFLYGLYCTMMKKMIKDEEYLPMPLMFGLLGLFNLIILWPVFFILNGAGWEVFELPSGRVFLFLLANGIFGTFISDLVESYSVVMTSPVINTIGLSLSIPLAMISDFVRKHQMFGWMYLFGSLLVVLGFLLANLASSLFEQKLKSLESKIINKFKYLLG